MSQLEKVLHAISPVRLRKTLLDLISIYSPSGKEEDIQLYLEELLLKAGFSVERQEVDEERYNLVVTMGEGKPELYLVAHVDTISLWDLEAFGPREEGDIIRGLGSSDMKGGCAAMVEAWLALGAALPPADQPRVGLLLVVGEEENGDGSITFLKSQNPSWVVIGEPTGLAACFAHYGYLEARFTTRGLQSHSSLPELGHNAVESMLRVLLHLGKDSLFDRDKSAIVYSIREMCSSQAGFVVPNRCEALIDLHLPPEKDPREIQDAIRTILANADTYIPGINVDVVFDFSSAGYNLGADNPMSHALRHIYPAVGLPFKQDSFRSHSDGNVFHAAGSKPIILGPGSLETAHTPDEYIIFDEVVAAVRLYSALCLSMNR